MNVRDFFVGACLAAAVLPSVGRGLLARNAGVAAPTTVVGTRSVSFEWPTHFRGQPLTQLAPTALEARFAHRFPGAVARFSDGEQLLIVRHVTRPTRLLHPASDCFRGAGYAIADTRAAVDAQGTRWRCFTATRGIERRPAAPKALGSPQGRQPAGPRGQLERLRVCERITEHDTEYGGERLDDPDRAAWTDVSAWFWDAQFGHAAAAWWAVTVVTPLALGADG